MEQATIKGGVAPTPWRPVTAAFADHARRSPDALAVEARGERRSYAELSTRVDLFAGRLARHLGTGDRLVGVCLARDVDLPAWLLAILKVGAAYLPIDPTTPATRLAHVIEDAGPALIVASRCYAGVVASVTGITVLFAEDENEEADAPPAPEWPIAPDTLAYVIFTSGSTGRPKGVEIEHGALAALMSTMADNPGFAAGERMLGLTRISFDLSVPDLFLPLFAGGSLILVDLDVAADPGRLAAAFDAYRPDLAQGTPSTWRALLENGWEGLPGLRILAGGEAMTRALADRLLPRCGELWNIYGPTETTVWSTACRIQPGDGAIPIGWPMAGISVRVVDARRANVPAGTVGEIAIGGTGLARGYRGRPALTAERFVALPDGTRAYLTGDLGRFDDAGALFCLGRLDDQVKVRGFRIELGDVEAALALHPAVAWCAVRVWNDPTGEPMLVGYIVPRGSDAVGARAVRSFLADHLAPYMLPDRIVMLAAMPLTANGKVDRAALPDPVAAVTPAAPADATIAARLATIWCELLGTDEIAPDDDFFALGGYSLMTVRLARRIEAAFGVRLALVEMMRHPQLATMAARIERGEQPCDAAPMLLNDGGDRPPLVWIDAGPLMQTMTRGLTSNQPARALNLDRADEEAFGSGALSIAEVAGRLRERLRAWQPAGPYYLGGWCRWGIVALELAQQLRDAGETVALLVLLDAEPSRTRPIKHRLHAQIRTWLRPPPATTATEPLSFSQRVEIATRSYVATRYAGDVLLLRPDTARGDGGWGRLVAGRLEIGRVPGDHVAMVRGASAQALAAKIDIAMRVVQVRIASRLAVPRVLTLPLHNDTFATAADPEVQRRRAGVVMG